MLDIVELIEVVVELYEGSREREVGHGDGRHGDVGDFGTIGLETLLFEGVGDLIETVDTTADFIALLAGEDVVGAGCEGDFHEGVFGDFFLRDEKLAGVQKLKRHGAGAGEVAVMAGEGGADIFRGAGLIVGGGLHDEGDAAGAVALVGDFFVDDAGDFAGALLDGAVDVFGGHIGFAGLEHEGAEAGVAVGIAAAGFGGEGEITEMREKTLPRRESVTALSRFTLDHLLCLATGRS